MTSDPFETPRPSAPQEPRGEPFHCPYCGGEDLWPHEGAGPDARGAWECRSCLRAFSLKMLGQIRPFETPRPSAPQEPPNGASS